MPWCESCSRFYNPNSVAADGTCPRCAQVIETTEPQTTTAERARVPWHFWLLLGALVLYLGWRFVQLVGWLVG